MEMFLLAGFVEVILFEMPEMSSTTISGAQNIERH